MPSGCGTCVINGSASCPGPKATDQLGTGLCHGPWFIYFRWTDYGDGWAIPQSVLWTATAQCSWPRQVDFDDHHDHEDIKEYADRQIRLVRKEDSPWRCFHMNSWEELFLRRFLLLVSHRCWGLSSDSATVIDGWYAVPCLFSRGGTGLLSKSKSEFDDAIDRSHCAIILEYLRTLYRSYSEISIAILMSGGLALALVLMNLSGELRNSINRICLGRSLRSHKNKSGS